MEITRTIPIHNISEKHTENAYKALYYKAVSFIAAALSVAEMGLMLCFCAVAAYKSEYLISVAVLMTDLGIITAIIERSEKL